MQTPPLPLPSRGGERLRTASKMGGEWPRASTADSSMQFSGYNILNALFHKLVELTFILRLSIFNKISIKVTTYSM